MIRSWFAGLLLALIPALVAHGELPGCIDSEVDPEYEPALRSSESLIRWGGVDTLTLNNGAEVLVGVGQVSIKPGVDFLKWRRAAELKASRAVSEFLEADVTAVSTLIKKTTTITGASNGALEERVQRVEKFLSTYVVQRTQMTTRIKLIGHWTSADGKYGYVASAFTPLGK